MRIDNNYEFKVSLSNDAYINKEIAGAMIGSTKDERNRLIRKQYGFKANQGVGYKEAEVTADLLLSELTHGKVFCHLFTPEKVRRDGCFSSSQKCNDNFKGSYVIGVDIDHTEYKTAEDFIAKLEYKPTFYYTSYSNLQEGKGARFRLIYVFDELISNKFYFRYCAYNLNKKIEADTGEVIDDDCNLRCAQYFNGTNIENENLIFSSGITHYIYSLSDFNVTKEGFIEFLDNGCYYKTNTHKSEIKNLLISYKPQQEVITSTTINLKMEKEELNAEVVIETELDSRFEFDERLLNDFDRLDTEEFEKQKDWVRYLHTTKYLWRVEKDEWEHGTYQFVGDDYFRLFFYMNTQRDGSKRRRNLYQRMGLRRIMNPEITAKELAFNAIVDIIRFYDNSDGLLNSDFIKRNVINVLQSENLEEELSSEISYLKAATRPKRGIIYKNRKAHTKQTTYRILDELYSFDKSVTENLALMELLEFPIKKSTIYNYLKDRGIKADNNKLTDEELLRYTNFQDSATDNYNFIKSQGFKISKNRYYKLYKNNKNQALEEASSLLTTTFNLKLEKEDLLVEGVLDKSTTYYNTLQKEEIVSEDNLEPVVLVDGITTEQRRNTIITLVNLQKESVSNSIERRALNTLPNNTIDDFAWL